MDVLVTGAAGFIGMHVARRLLERGDAVLGVDSLNAYYDPALKHARLQILERYPKFRFIEMDLAERQLVKLLSESDVFSCIVHLAGQAGVRYSTENPAAYVDANLVGFANILELARTSAVRHLVYASSSSVYGASSTAPFREDERADRPISLYAATKKANELMAYAYSHLYGIPATGLRFFTVYGPWGRPDMAYFSFTKAMLAGQPIRVFAEGRLLRDFTYIDDIVEAVLRVADTVPVGEDGVPHRLYNIGNDSPVSVLEFIATLEDVTGVRATCEMLPMQPGDVPATHADVGALEREIGFRPSTTLGDGLAHFVDWYRDYYRQPLGGQPTEADV